MKQISFLLSILILSVFMVCSCDSKSDDLRIEQIGSTIILRNNAQYTYYIKELDAKIIDGLYVNNDYTYNPEGDPYIVKDKQGRKMGTVYLSPKQDLFTNVIELDLNTYSESGYWVDPNVDKVIVGSEDKRYSGPFALFIEEREKPLDIEFINVSIVNNGVVSVISNFSSSALNIYLNDGVEINAGSVSSSVEAEKFQQLAFDALMNYTKGLLKYKAVPLAAIKTFATGKLEYATSYIDGLIAVSQTALDSFESLLLGKDGSDGLDGAPAIMSVGPIHFSGEGTSSIMGGSGGNGSDGSSSITGRADGGDGGDAAPAVLAPTIVISSARRNIEMKAGMPGDGGLPGSGAFGITGSGRKGSRGKSNENYLCNDYYWR
ncbi:MAG: hypothetical protein E7350_00300 [Clostridiales bacterium]|nr:hypothetical protein [Clostridiales bacterium]